MLVADDTLDPSNIEEIQASTPKKKTLIASTSLKFAPIPADLESSTCTKVSARSQIFDGTQTLIIA